MLKLIESFQRHLQTVTDSASIQLSSGHTTPIHVAAANRNACLKPSTPNRRLHAHAHGDCQPMCHAHSDGAAKRALLATVRAPHATSRCRQAQHQQQVRQQLITGTEDGHAGAVLMVVGASGGSAAQACPAHGLQAMRGGGDGVVGGDGQDEDVEEEGEEEEDGEHIRCSRHDTPSHVPLIWRPSTPSPPSPATTAPTNSVPTPVALLLFAAYALGGALAYARATSSTLLDGAYAALLALATIGVGAETHRRQPAQWQLLAAAVYLFVGLVLVATCFALVHERWVGGCWAQARRRNRR